MSVYGSGALALIAWVLVLLPEQAPAQAAEADAGFGCFESGATRIQTRADCVDDRLETRVIHREVEHPITLRMPGISSNACRATVRLDYQQRNTLARVSGTVKNEICAASSGSFVISATVRNEAGVVSSLDFPQAWQREDDAVVELHGDHYIGEGMYLVSVRAKSSICHCVEAGQAE